MSVPFTKENAAEMQRKSVEARKANQEEAKLFKAIIAQVFDEEITAKDGSKVSSKVVTVRGIIKKAMQGDVGAVKWLADMLGETPEKKTAVDITSGGKAIEPITGVVVMPSTPSNNETN